MTQITRRVPVLLAVLAFSAVAATAAQATTEGPYFKINGKRLETGQTAEVKMNLGETEVEASDSLVTLRCSSMKLKPGAKFVGSTGANSGKFEGAFEFTSCKESEHESTLCEAKTIVTKTLTGTLGYKSEARTGGIVLSVGKPRGGGKIMEGTCGDLTGGFTLESFGHAEGKEVGEDTVGHEFAEAVDWDTWMFTAKKAGWAEVAGAIKGETRWLLLGELGEVRVAPQLIRGVELVSGAKWGIYTTA